MRKVITFSGLLRKNLRKAELTDKTSDYLDRIADCSGRMQHLIEDLLQYSSTDMAREKFMLTNLNAVVADVIKDFDVIISTDEATIEVKVLPEIQAIPLQMQQLFHNLISNALKFRRENVPPIIRIWAHPLRDGELSSFPGLSKEQTYNEIIFKDNGIGFDNKYGNQIFDIFQRLNSKGKYAGTGIGLALCKKIVSHHGGHIFAVSDEGKGSEFHVILADGDLSIMNGGGKKS
jgi:two-component system CheB/CheR fusion protein